MQREVWIVKSECRVYAALILTLLSFVITVSLVLTVLESNPWTCVALTVAWIATRRSMGALKRALRGMNFG